MTAHTDTTVVVSAYQEAERLPATLAALRAAFPGARLIVGDDGSRDATPDVAREAGVELVRSERTIGKGGAMTRACERALEGAGVHDVIVVCDGDLADTARELPALVEAVRAGGCDIAIGAFASRVGGGLGLAVGFARWATQRRGGLTLGAPISGQRALTIAALRAVLPFAPRFGMETAMNIDAARAGLRLAEIELPLAHRATGKSLRGFLHRGRQLKDFVLVYLSRR